LTAAGDRTAAETESDPQAVKTRMKTTPKIRVRFWDQMVLIGIGLALFYTIFESILSIFLQVNVDFMQRIFGTGPSTIYSRLTILCLFAIFGSHAQYTINQRQAAEAALRESEERFRLIIENSPVGYFELDLKGSFVFFNNATCDILGYPAHELSWKGQSDVADAASRSRLSEAFERVLASAETAKSLDWVLTRRDGTKRFAESSISLLKDRKGRPSGYSVFLRDITERKRSEALLRAKLAAEAASRTKGEFLASMSHEIRTPLNAIIGLVELQLGTDLTADQREDLDVVKSSAYALLSIINNVLDFSKIEAGKLELEQTRFSMESFLDESVRIMAMKAHLKGLELAYRMEPDVPDRLIGDPNRLRQVVLNLVDNAIKFTERGEVIVHVSLREETPTEVRLQFTVTDTGIGVAPDKQQRIFKPYDQGDPAVARRFGGTGLGLAVSSRLVRMMGGQIALSSRPGQGSAFGFTALFGRPPDVRETPAGLPAEELQEKSVLVVDDNAMTRRIVKEILERHRMEVHLAGSAEEARPAFVDGKSPGMVLVDSGLPGADGFSCVEWLRQEAGYRGPVILMLTFTHLKRKSECPGLGVTATLLKPFGTRELLQVLAKAVKSDPPSAAIKMGLAAAPISEPSVQEPPPASLPVGAVRGLRILVAEDTPVNQKFILRLLDRWGHTAVLVDDGRKAVTEAARTEFDVVLMDVQMPEMDGLEAAAAIRKLETGSRRHLPIIAMTAHAIKGDRERCLAAGMDDYLSKPIDADMLKQLIARLTATDSTPEMESVGAAMMPGVLKAFENDWGFFADVVDVFFSDYPRQLENLRTSAQRQDAATFRRAAHSLKGMLRNFQAEASADKAFRLESMGQSGNLDGAELLIEELATEVKHLEVQLRTLIKEKLPHRTETSASV
jgi:PAS domain S-box-containing protein